MPNLRNVYSQDTVQPSKLKTELMTFRRDRMKAMAADVESY
jgi:hypothetical protein